MKPRSVIVVSAVGAVVSGLSLCQPPTPRIAEVDSSSYRVAATPGAGAKHFLPAFGRVKQAVQVHDLDGLPSLVLIRYR